MISNAQKAALISDIDAAGFNVAVVDDGQSLNPGITAPKTVLTLALRSGAAVTNAEKQALIGVVDAAGYLVTSITDAPASPMPAPSLTPASTVRLEIVLKPTA